MRRFAGNDFSIGRGPDCHPVFATKDVVVEIVNFNASRGSVSPHIVGGLWGDGKRVLAD